MTAPVHADAPAPRHALHRHLKPLYVLTTQDQGRDAARVGVAAVDGVGEVALEAARIPGELVRRDRPRADARPVGQVEGDGAEVDDHVGEGPGSHAAAARARGQVDGRQPGGCAEDDVA